MTMSLELYMTVCWGVVIVYVLATVATVSGILFHKERLQQVGSRCAAGGLFLHTALIAAWWYEVGHGPYMAPNEVLSSDAWIMVASYFIFLRLYPRIRPVSMVAFPAAFLMLALSQFYNPGIRTLPATFRSVWLLIHIGLYKIALATLIIATGFAVLYLLKKHSSRDWLQRLPLLETLDSYCYRFTGFGFIFWTIGMLAGSIWAYQSWGRFWGWDPTETWALITCLMFGLYLHLRRFCQLKGERAAGVLIVCFGIAVVTLFGMATLNGSIHSDYFR